MSPTNNPEHLYYSTDHEWLDTSDIKATIGITAFAAGELGDIVYLELPQPGTVYQAGEVIGTIEAVKTVSDLFMPVSGTIIETNSALNQTPELVNSDPFGEGWLIKISLTDNDEANKLLSASAYSELTGQ